LEEDGWYPERQSGSHLILRHPVKSGNLVVPFHGSREIARGLMNKILKEAGIK
jgi:mRNA interferase HicA